MLTKLASHRKARAHIQGLSRVVPNLCRTSLTPGFTGRRKEETKTSWPMTKKAMRAMFMATAAPNRNPGNQPPTNKQYALTISTWWTDLFHQGEPCCLLIEPGCKVLLQSTVKAWYNHDDEA